MNKFNKLRPVGPGDAYKYQVIGSFDGDITGPFTVRITNDEEFVSLWLGPSEILLTHEQAIELGRHLIQAGKGENQPLE